jgi:hypothetical protein
VAAIGVLGAFVFAAAPALASSTLQVSAHTSVTRTYNWTITKVAHNSSITLTPGGTYQEEYTVTVTNTGYTDSNWQVSDGIHYSSDTPFTPTGTFASATQGAVTTQGTTGDPTDKSGTCSPLFNTQTTDLYCAYSVSLPSADPGYVTAGVNFSDGSSTSTTTAFDFTNPTYVNPVNYCVLVSDTLEGPLGTVCANQHSVTFDYLYTITAPTQCGTSVVNNTASLNDSLVHPSSASAGVHVNVPCVGGCTLTIGYWKNHAGFGPQADVVTPLLPQWLGTSGGAKSLDVTTAGFAVQLLSFYGSNNVFSASNGINKLYAQLLAAKLNIANGADGSAISSTIAAADAFLASNNSTSWASLTKAQQQAVNSWMSALDNYNNGLTGPGHCDNM